MRKKTSHTALFLVLIMLISNVGISMDVLWCHCTKQLKVVVFGEVEPNKECCQHKAQSTTEPQQHNCCQKKRTTTKTIQNSCAEKINKKCCTNTSQYFSLDQAQTQDHLSLDLSGWVVALFSLEAVAFIDFQDWILPALYRNKINNKAPPLPSGRQLLQAIQRYIC